MSGSPDDPKLIALGAAISDGTALDWTRLERETAGADNAHVVRNLRRVAALVDAHRTGAAAPSLPDAQTGGEAPQHWRHLVLFETIGAGAFGRVHRGWDPHLDREVAVKLLPRSRTLSDAPLAEARHLARIRHPNVVVVYGADQDAEQVGIWMEYIEGHHLADLVRDRGPMSAREVIGIGIDLCRALSALHASSLLHGDIKAHNVTREVGGRIVLMDFSGAQRLSSDDSVPAFLSGTPLYMAPELFEGAAASIATDVYSLGVLLFFLLSGRLPVEGSTAGDIKRAHAEGRRLRLRDVRSDIDGGVVQVIERAIARDPGARYHSAGELEHALSAATGARPTAMASAVPGGRTWRQRGLVAAALGVAALGGALAHNVWQRVDPVPPVARFTIGPPYNTASWPRLSPDGRNVAFGTIVAGKNRFWVRALDKPDGWALANTVAGETPFWSPDGRTLAFFADDKLKAVPVDGGHVRVVADAPRPHGGSWSRDGLLLFGRDDGIHRVDADGTHDARVTTLDSAQDEFQHAWPEFLPDGRHFLFVIRSKNADRSGLYLGSIDSAERRRIVAPPCSRAAYAGGYLWFVLDGTLVAQRFDPDSARLAESPVIMASQVKFHPQADAAFDVSSSGVLIYGLEGGGLPSTRLMLFDRRGRELSPIADTGSYRQPRFSPDGRRIVAERFDPDSKHGDIWVYGVSQRSAAMVTNHEAQDMKPVWSRDGHDVIFSSKRGPIAQIYRKTVDSRNPERLVIATEGDALVEDWSTDERFVSGTWLRNGLWVWPLAPGGKPWRVRPDTGVSSWLSEFSPDGRWIAYTEIESGSPQVYIEPWPLTGSRWQISPRGGGEPHWRADGRELFYLSADGIMSVATPEGGAWDHLEPPRPLFRVNVPDIAGDSDYAVSPKGDLVVVNTFISDPAVPPIQVVVNWRGLLPR